MKIFISWSGGQAKAMAAAFHWWIPLVAPGAKPFFSRDMDAGSRWNSEIAKELESTAFGLVCVTSQNQESPWLNFEAGSLAKAVDQACVIPIALDLDVAEIKQPLGQFFSQPATKEGMIAAVLAINKGLDSPEEDQMVLARLEPLWSGLEKRLEAARALSTALPVRRADSEIIDEILTTVRALDRRMTGVLTAREPLRMPAAERVLRHRLDYLNIPTSDSDSIDDLADKAGNANVGPALNAYIQALLATREPVDNDEPDSPEAGTVSV